MIVGYFRNFGVRATPDRIRPVIEEAVATAELAGDIAWAESKWDPVDVTSLDDSVRSRIVPVAGEGVWYMSGRMFFPEETEA